MSAAFVNWFRRRSSWRQACARSLRLARSVGSLGFNSAKAGCQDAPVHLGEQHRDAAAQRGELVAVMTGQSDDESLAFEPPQVVGGLAAGVRAAQQGGDGPDQGGVVEPGEQVGDSDDGGQHRHHPRVPERQSRGVLTVNLGRSGHLGEGGHIRSGLGIGGLRVAQTLVGVLAKKKKKTAGR